MFWAENKPTSSRDTRDVLYLWIHLFTVKQTHVHYSSDREQHCGEYVKDCAVSLIILYKSSSCSSVADWAQFSGVLPHSIVVEWRHYGRAIRPLFWACMRPGSTALSGSGRWRVLRHNSGSSAVRPANTEKYIGRLRVRGDVSAGWMYLTVSREDTQ